MVSYLKHTGVDVMDLENLGHRGAQGITRCITHVPPLRQTIRYCLAEPRFKPEPDLVNPNLRFRSRFGVGLNWTSRSRFRFSPKVPKPGPN